MMARLDGTIIALCLLALLVAVTLWRAHRSKLVAFDLLDLLLEGGRVSKIAVAFMLVLGTSTWVIIHQTVHDKLTEGMFGLWLTAWVTPLVAKVVFNKSEAPGAKDANQVAG